MPKLFSLARAAHAGTCDPFLTPAGSGTLPAKQQKFRNGLLDRWSRRKEKDAAPISIEGRSPNLAAARAAPPAKPVDYAVLEKMNSSRIAAEGAARQGNPKEQEKADTLARALHPLAETYLAWAAQQRGQDELALRRCKVAGILAQVMKAVEGGARPSTEPATPAGDNSPPRRSSVSSNSSSRRSSVSSNSSSRRSSAASSVSEPGPRSPAPAQPSGRSTQWSFRRGMEALANFRKTLTAPNAGSFEELEEAFKAAKAAFPFKERHGMRVRQLATQYLDRHTGKSGGSDLRQKEIAQARNFLSVVDAEIVKVRWERQRGIDETCTKLNSAHLSERTADRGRRAASLVLRFPELHPTGNGTSHRIVKQCDGSPLYRFIPMPTRRAAGHVDIAPQHAVLASTLHRKLVEQVGLDLRFPCATTATLDGVAGVLVDDTHPSLPDTQISQLADDELQRAVLAQWVLGKPRATWDDVNIDFATGELRARWLPTAPHAPRDIAREGLQGVSPMLSHPDTQEPIPGLHRPIDASLARQLLHIDFEALKLEMLDLQNKVDFGNVMNGVRVGHSRQHVAVSQSDAIDRLLEPLRALQSALRADPQLPLAMVLADAAEELSRSPYE